VGEGIYLCSAYEVEWEAVVEVLYPDRAALVDTLAVMLQDTLQITAALVAPPISSAAPWVDCRFVSHTVESDGSAGQRRSLITLRIKQEL
jgi:hypothetical protein